MIQYAKTLSGAQRRRNMNKAELIGNVDRTLFINVHKGSLAIITFQLKTHVILCLRFHKPAFFERVNSRNTSLRGLKPVHTDVAG